MDEELMSQPGYWQIEIETLNKLLADQARLDYLQELLDASEYTGLVILRNSVTKRGFRLHETSHPGAVKDVREAIDNYRRDNGG